LARIDYQIMDNRRMMSLPPPKERNLIRAPPLTVRAESRGTEAEEEEEEEDT
jgi:hypothetical protein